MREVKAKMDQTVQDTIVATRIIDGFRSPQQHGAYLKNYVNFPLEYVNLSVSGGLVIRLTYRYLGTSQELLSS